MRRPREWLALVLIALVLLAVVVVVALTAVTDRRRAASVARLPKPASAVAYEQLVAASESQREEQAPEAALAAYDTLFALQEDRLGDNAEWNEVMELALDANRRVSEEERRRIDEFLLAHQDLLDEIRRLARLGGPVYALDFSEGFSMALPHLAKMRDLARLLSVSAVHRANSGDTQGAVDDLLAGMRLADALALEPLLISQLVRIAMYGIVEANVAAAFGPGDLSPEQTRQLVAQLGEADRRQGFVDSFAMEGHVGVQAFEDLRDGDLDVDLFQSFLSDSGPLAGPVWNTALRVYTGPLGAPWFNRDEETYADTMARLAEAVDRPYYEAKPLLEAIEQDIDDLPPWRPLSQVLLPALTRSAEAQARHEAQIHVTRLGLLLEQHHAQHGTYPATLDAVASGLGTAGLGASVPVDPFTGEPYTYQPSVDTFLLYSVGPNLIDDFGRHHPRDYDIVWRGDIRSHE